MELMLGTQNLKSTLWKEAIHYLQPEGKWAQIVSEGQRTTFTNPLVPRHSLSFA